jgi:hypothetical protein
MTTTGGAEAVVEVARSIGNAEIRGVGLRHICSGWYQAKFDPTITQCILLLLFITR